MSDSLRDQLIAAGYKAPKEEKKKQSQQKQNKKKKTGKKKVRSRTTAVTNPASHAKSSAQPPLSDAAVAERKKLKAQIKELIEEHKIDEYTGETAYRYTVDSRIRELYVKDDIQARLATRELAITRLNGSTYVVPREIALSIQQINPQWSVFNLDEKSPASDDSEEYSEYKVPDDLKW